MDNQQMHRRFKPTPQQQEYCLQLARRGYRRTSAKHGIVTRVDRPDWLQVMAKAMKKAVADYYLVDTPRTVAPGWADHYRRVYSKDNLYIGPDLARMLPESTNDSVGFIDDNGEERRQVGVVCMLHGTFRDAVRCPVCIAPDMLITALGKVIPEIREGAKFDADWEAVEEAYDLLTKETSRQQQPPDLVIKENPT